MNRLYIMRKILLVSTVMAAASFTAHATSNAFDGFYIGAGVGGVRSKTKTDVVNSWISSIDVSVTPSKTSNGFLFGLYSGYGRSLNNFYIGGEISIVGDSANRHVNLVNATDPANPILHYVANIKYKREFSFGVSPRFGYASGNNLIYIKPGIEISRDQVTATYIGTNSTTPQNNESSSASVSKTHIGFAPSFGYEKACSHIILRAEYTYNPGKKISIHSNDKNVAGYDNASCSDHRVMVGIAYKF